MNDLRHDPQPPRWPLPDEAVEAALRRVFSDGSWGKYHGPNCLELTKRLASMHSTEHVILTCSGTAAVEMALRGLRVGSGDEVILSAYDFEGNLKNVLAVGAKPVLIDVDPVSGQLDVNQLEAARSPQTKAVIVSHLHGGTVAMPIVRAFADRHQIAVLEDACQVPGTMLSGRIAGTWGDVGVLSFGGSKLLTAGRGGAIITRNQEIAQRIRVQTYRGNDAYPLSELQAAVLVPQLERLTERNRIRAENVSRLLNLLRDFAGLSCLVNAESSNESVPGFYKLGFWFDSNEFGCSRDAFTQAMRAAGVAFDPGFRALHLTHARSRFLAVNDLPNATRADESIVVLHHPVLLGTNEDIQGIREAFRALTKGKVGSSGRTISS